MKAKTQRLFLVRNTETGEITEVKHSSFKQICSTLNLEYHKLKQISRDAFDSGEELVSRGYGIKRVTRHI